MITDGVEPSLHVEYKASHVKQYFKEQRALRTETTINNPKDFYINKLGFEVRTDHTMEGGFRWLTVGPKTQPDLEMVLMEPKAGPMFDEESAQAIRLLLKKGVLGSGVFQVDDCHKTYEDVKNKACSLRARRKIPSTA